MKAMATPNQQGTADSATETVVSQAPAQPAAGSFSLVKLACNGVIMLQLNDLPMQDTALPLINASVPAVSGNSSHGRVASADTGSAIPAVSSAAPCNSRLKPVEALRQILADIAAGSLKVPQ